MNISFENPDKINGSITITVEEKDFKDDVEKELKDYRRKAEMPGFRKGMVPMGLIRKQIGMSVKVDTINKVLGKALQDYITGNKIKMLGQPLGSKDQEPVDLEKDAPYVFKFDIAVEPDFKAELSDKDSITYYNIKVDDKLIDQQVDMFQNQAGKMGKADEYDADKRDRMTGDLRELDANGNTLEGGITVEGVSLMPSFFSDDSQKGIFAGAKAGDILTFNPTTAYKDNEGEVASLLRIDKEKVAEHKGDFSYQITEINRFIPAENNKELWDTVYGKDADIKDEKQFRDMIAKGLQAQLVQNSDFQFLQDARKYCEKKVGEVKYPEDLLRRVMLENNKDKGEEFVNKNFDQSIKELHWHLIKEQLAEASGVKVEDADVRAAAHEMARAQFAQYGMQNVPDEYVNNYADELLKKGENVESFVERALDLKLTQALKKVVKLDTKEISLDDFNKLAEAE